MTHNDTRGVGSPNAPQRPSKPQDTFKSAWASSNKRLICVILNCHSRGTGRPTPVGGPPVGAAPVMEGAPVGGLELVWGPDPGRAGGLGRLTPVGRFAIPQEFTRELTGVNPPTSQKGPQGGQSWGFLTAMGPFLRGRDRKWLIPNRDPTYLFIYLKIYIYPG